MNDNLIIQSIHPEAKQMVVVFNINGVEYPKVLPFFTTSDAELLKTQLKSVAKELRDEFTALKTAVESADANQPQTVSDAVAGLEGQSIPVDVAATAASQPADGSTPAGDPTAQQSAGQGADAQQNLDGTSAQNAPQA